MVDAIVLDKQRYWDSCAQLYDERIQMITYQQYVTLATHTEASNAKRILELAIGTGTHTLFLAKTLLKRGATLVCTEISQKMLELAKSKFEDEEFASFKHNRVSFTFDESYLSGSPKISIENLRDGLDEKDRFVFGCIANNEVLPFPDSHFDCYIAPLSLQLVHSYSAMLAEAYRVTSAGGKVGFSVWGRREHIQMYPLLERVLERHGLGPATKPTKTNYDICLNREEVRKLMTEMGFTNIKMWFQPVNYIFDSFEDFY